MSPAQEKLMEFARRRGWVRPIMAADFEAARGLVERGLLEPHPEHERAAPVEAGVLRVAASGHGPLRAA